MAKSKASAATASAAAAAAVPAPVVEEIEEVVVPEPSAAPRTVTFVLGEDADDEILDGAEEDDHDDIDEEDIEDEEADEEEDAEEDFDDLEDDALTTAVGQLTQLMMTEEGEAITDVLSGLRESIEKQNKILYRGLQVLEARFAPGRR